MSLAALALAFFIAAPCAAQPVGVNQDPFGPLQKREAQKAKEEKEKAAASTVLPFAEALYSAFTPEEWTALKISSSTPKQALSGYMRAGYYRQELVLLALIGLKGGKGLPELAKRRHEHNESLRSLAESLKLDYMDLLNQAQNIKQKLDLQAVPLEEAESSSRAARAKAKAEEEAKKGHPAEEEYDEP